MIEFIDYVFCRQYFDRERRDYVDLSYRPYLNGVLFFYSPFFIVLLNKLLILKGLFGGVGSTMILVGPFVIGAFVAYLFYKVFGRFKKVDWERLLDNSSYKRIHRTIWVINIISLIITALARLR